MGSFGGRGIRYSPAVKRAVIDDYQRGVRPDVICKKYRRPDGTPLARRTLFNWVNAAERILQAGPEEFIPEPLHYDELTPLAKSWLGPDDRILPAAFGKFCQEALGLQIRPFWGELAAELSDPANPNVLVTIMPGVGKTTCVLAYLDWRVLRARALAQRDFSVIYGSSSETLARRGLRQIRNWSSEPLLAKEFGRMEPTGSEESTWSKTQLVIAGMGKGKEPTFSVYGATSRIRGARPNIMVWDDPQDSTNADPESTNQMMEWWDADVADRVEPGPENKTAVIMTYASPTDIAHALADRVYVDSRGTQIKTWRQVRFPAHDEVKCPGDGTHPAYPEGCLLWPERWSYDRILRKSQENEFVFKLQYQLQDLPSGEVLVPEAWMTGLKDSKRDWPGCLDEDREMWELPEIKLSDKAVSLATLDPSQTQWSSFQVWVYDSELDLDILVAYERMRLRGDDLYAEVITNWTEHAREIGLPFSTWVVEQTGNIYFLESKTIRDLWSKLGCDLIKHQTTTRKSDREQGPWMFRDRFRYGKVRLPWAPGPTREALRPFFEEHTRFPFHRTDDSVMGDHFYHWNKSLVIPPSLKPTRMWRPSWLLAESRSVSAR